MVSAYLAGQELHMQNSSEPYVRSDDIALSKKKRRSHRIAGVTNARQSSL